MITTSITDMTFNFYIASQFFQSWCQKVKKMGITVSILFSTIGRSYCPIDGIKICNVTTTKYLKKMKHQFCKMRSTTSNSELKHYYLWKSNYAMNCCNWCSNNKMFSISTRCKQFTKYSHMLKRRHPAGLWDQCPTLHPTTSPLLWQ